MQVDEDVQQASASFVTPNYFTELGTPAAYGRMIDPARDAGASDAPVVVLSYGFWERRFGSNPSVIGTTIHLNKKAATIVGITPLAFASLGGQHPDVWIPIAQQPYFVDGSSVLTDPSNSAVRMWGRLAPGVKAPVAEQELRGLTKELRKQHPKDIWDHEYLQSSPGGHLQVMQPAMFQVAAMVSILTLLILAVACANLGGLLLARGVTRQHEMGIRMAIGAGRWRLFRQLCTESLLLAALGSLAGLALGCFVLEVALQQMDAPKWLSALPDWRVLVFTLGVTFFAAMFFGLAPAIQLARQKHQRTVVRQVLVGAQVAGSCVLLIVAGLLVRAAQHALFTDPGFGYEQLLSIDAQLGQHGYKPAAAKAYLDQMQSRLAATPGVLSVSLVKLPPLGHTVSNSSMEIGGRQVYVYPNWVEPGFFKTMGIPQLMGRTFHEGETNAVIVSQSFARQQWPGQNPVGQLIGDGPQRDIVVGVVGNARVNALNEDDAVEQYWPAQLDDMPGMVVMVRASGAPGALSPVAKSISESLDPKLFPEIRQIRLLYRDQVVVIERIASTVSVIGLVAVLLAGVGIIGLVSFTVSQRTKEIAIRVALGARPAAVLSSVLRHYWWPVVIGLLAGGSGAAAASTLLRRALYGVSNLDPIGYSGAIAVLIVVIALAALLPARRALRLDLAKTLRYE